MKATKHTNIFIKFHYGIWYPVSKREARRFCEFLMRRMTCPDDEGKRCLIEERFLKGITVDELFDENGEGCECKEGNKHKETIEQFL